jgi:hypothetical protein
MIRQYLPNNNETTTVAFRQKFCQLNSLKSSWLALPAFVRAMLACTGKAAENPATPRQNPDDS